MTLKIEARMGVEVYVNNANTVSIVNPDQPNEHGGYDDTVVVIHPDYIDSVIKALQECKNKILMGNEMGNG